MKAVALALVGVALTIPAQADNLLADLKANPMQTIAHNAMIYYCMGRSGMAFGVNAPDDSPIDRAIKQCIRHLSADWQYYAKGGE